MGLVTEPLSTQRALLVRAADGDMDAFGALYDQFVPLVRRFLLGLRMPLAQQDLEDAVQETFLKLHRGLKRFDPERPLRPYLMTIARNVAIGLCRKQTSDKSQPAGEVVEGAPDEDGGTPSDRVSKVERAEILGEALAALDPELRTVLVLRHISGAQMKELEQVLDCSAPTARARVREAGHRLAVELRRRGLAPEEVCR
jgi:RNA polymerase sigma-70 factor (ECF subfamily)